MTVKQCDKCGKIYIPDSEKSSKRRFRISDTEPTLHVSDLCYDCLDALEQFMGKTHSSNWNPRKSKKAAITKEEEKYIIHDVDTTVSTATEVTNVTGPVVIKRGGAE